MKTPKVSVIMNCRNSDEFLVEAIESVVAQTFTDWEIIFWDNLSIDSSAAIAKKYEGKLRYFRGEIPLTLGAARNAAISQARGEYLTFLDCDDVWLPEKLERQLGVLNNQRDVAFVYTDSQWIGPRGESLGKRQFEHFQVPTGDHFMALLTGRCFIHLSTLMIRHAIVNGIGGFTPDMNSSEDLHLYLRVLRNRQYRALPILEVLAKYRLHGSNTTGRGSVPATLEVMQTLRKASKTAELSKVERLKVLGRQAVLGGKLLTLLVR